MLSNATNVCNQSHLSEDCIVYPDYCFIPTFRESGNGAESLPFVNDLPDCELTMTPTMSLYEFLYNSLLVAGHK